MRRRERPSGLSSERFENWFQSGIAVAIADPATRQNDR
jgi:hypothetical protein